MQVTVALSDEPDTGLPFTLRLPWDDGTGLSPCTCSLCDQRYAVWYADPASDAALDPKASPILSGEACAECLNGLVGDGTVVVTELDPHSF